MSEAEFDFDLFVIGAGSGGVRASRIASSHGAKVAIAEEYRVGGTCVIRGCVPKKLLVYGATFAEELEHAEAFGWTLGERHFEWGKLRDFVAGDIDRLERAYTNTLHNNSVEHFAERATIAGPNQIKLASGRLISAKYILVAVGGWPVMPAFDGAQYCISSNEVFHLKDFPKRVVIQGSGYIGLEFAGIFNALGAEVTVVNRSDKILRDYDSSITDRLLAITQARGIQYRLGAPIVKVEKLDGGLRVHTEGGGASIDADCVLVATGRRPKTDALGLENAGITLRDDGAIPVDEFNKTACSSIYAVGDVTNRVQLTPVAIREGHAVADSLFGAHPRTVDYSFIPSAVFSQPPLAGVGLTEDQARKSYANVAIYTSDFRPMKNMFAEKAERGLYKLVVDQDTDKVLGVHMIGPEVPEILQAVAISVRYGLTKSDFDATIALHPSMAEELVLMR